MTAVENIVIPTVAACDIVIRQCVFRLNCTAVDLKREVQFLAFKEGDIVALAEENIQRIGFSFSLS